MTRPFRFVSVALAAGALLFTVTACSRATRPPAGQNGRQRPDTATSREEPLGRQARVIPADAWKTPDSYWNAWRDKRQSTVQPAVAGRTYHASPEGNDDGPGTADRPWRTLQKAAAVMAPGDMLLIADGEYPGNLVQRRSGEPGKPIVYRALHPGKAVILGDQVGPRYDERRNGAASAAPSRSPGGHDLPSPTRDAVHIDHSDYVTVEGLLIRSAVRAGLRVDNSNHVTVRDCRCVQNGVWGIFSNYSDDLVLEYNEAAWSAGQHGIYVSNSGDRPVLRYNTCHDNTRAGIQLNGDSKLQKPNLGKRGDGLIEDAVIEGNVLYENGAGGAAALNLACVHNAKIVNNLIFHNLASGIALFNDHRRDVTEFGSKKNRILHNTLYFRPGEGRYCLSIKHGSTDNIIRNNILSGGRRGAFEYDDTSSFVSDHNLLWSADPRSPIASDQDSRVNLRFEELKSEGSVHTAPQFVNSDKAPFDFHLRSVPARAVEESAVSVDLDGKSRAAGKRSIGCYEEK